MDTVVHGVVRVGCVDLPYLRAGAGAQVLLLRTGTSDAIGTADTFRRLSGEFRVFAPVLVPDPGSPPQGTGEVPSVHLRDLLEGLGLERPVLVVEGNLERLAGPASVDPSRDVAAVLWLEMDPGGNGLDALVRSVRRAVAAGR